MQRCWIDTCMHAYTDTLHMHVSAWKFVALNCYKKKRSGGQARGRRASHARTPLDSIVDDHATPARTAPIVVVAWQTLVFVCFFFVRTSLGRGACISNQASQICMRLYG